MATKKNKKAAQSQEVRPEQYLRTRVRQLPIYKCYNCVSTKDSREMVVVVARQHTQGEYHFWCLYARHMVSRRNGCDMEVQH